MYPFQLFLREILIANSAGGNATAAGGADVDALNALIEDAEHSRRGGTGGIAVNFPQFEMELSQKNAFR